MALDFKLGLKLGQNLVMTPQLQQAIKLLQLNRMELAEVINQELVENPVLEELGETSEGESSIDGDAPPDCSGCVFGGSSRAVFVRTCLGYGVLWAGKGRVIP